VAAMSVLEANVPLRRKMARCGERNANNDTRWFCGHVACPVCMQRRGTRLFRQRLWPALHTVSPDRLRWITVLMISDASLDDGAIRMIRQHRRLQYVFQKFAGGTGKNRTTKMRVWGAREVERAGSEWLFHTHLLVDLAGSNPDRLARLLRGTWPGDRHVQVKGMEKRDHQKNLERLARYMCKARYTKAVDSGTERMWMTNEEIVALVGWRDRQSSQWYRFTWGVRGS
jgi:hypothetical protein